MTDTGLVRRLWGGKDLAPLWTLARRRLERGRGTGSAPLVLRDPNPATRAAVASLLDARLQPTGDIRVSVTKLEAAVADSSAHATLAEVLGSLGPPLRDRPAERRADEARWGALWAEVGDHPAVNRHPDLVGWLAELRRTGRLRRDPNAAETLAVVLDVLAVLPVEPPTTRSRLAANLGGRAHGLDDRRGRLVAAALAYLTGVPTPSSDAGRRALWAEAGVEIEPVLSRVSVLGLLPAAVGPLTEAAGRWADAGVALVVHLGAITTEAWLVGEVQVRVCENPAVLEEAAQSLGPACAPLVCVEGQLSVAAAHLLAQLSSSGARLAYHGDFGAGGLTIANRVIGHLGAEPWRMSVADHAVGLRRAQAEGLTPARLRGTVPDACWDPALAPAIRACGVEIDEELVITELLIDLANE